MNLIDILKDVGISDVIDIAFMSLLIYSVLVWFKKTRAAFVLVGMFIIGGAYLLAKVFDLYLTASVFQAFFAVILIAVIVIFQEEIKHFFEHVASLGFIRKLRGKKVLQAPRKNVEVLTRTLSDLARQKFGALIVIRGKDPIVRHLDGGFDLDGELSEILEQFNREVAPEQRAPLWKDFFKRNYREKAIAVSVTLVLWFFFRSFTRTT